MQHQAQQRFLVPKAHAKMWKCHHLEFSEGQRLQMPTVHWIVVFWQSGESAKVQVMALQVVVLTHEEFEPKGLLFQLLLRVRCEAARSGTWQTVTRPNPAGNYRTLSGEVRLLHHFVQSLHSRTEMELRLELVRSSV